MRSAWQMNKSIYNDFSIPSGFTNFKYNNAAHVFILIPKKEGSEQEFIINKNDPLAHIIPLTEKEIVLTHRVDKDFVRIGDRCVNTMAPEYLAREKLMKENEELLG
jgi:hypothetical protein